MSVTWAPSGREFATGSYDRTIRIFKSTENTAREIYHTKRMQRVFTVQYSFDHKFISSGSDDGNIRVWKSEADQELGILNHREIAAKQYRKSLIQRHQHLPEVKKIYRFRKIPKSIRNQSQQAKTQKDSQARKHANRVKYGQGSFVGESEKTVVREEE
jgi:DDB1- and CUL4-associated factor 13